MDPKSQADQNRKATFAPRLVTDDSVPGLVRNATDSFMALVAAHLKFANFELLADIESRTRRLAAQMALAVVAIVGYGLLMVGVALAAIPWLGRSVAFVILGALHITAAGIALVVLATRKRRALHLEHAMHAVGKSVTEVTDAVLGPSGQPHVRN